MSASAQPSFTRRIVSLAWPVLIGQWAVMAYGVVDTAMAGHASPLDLATLGIGNAIFYSVLIGLLGLVLALNPILSRIFGAGDLPSIGEHFVQGLWVAVYASLFGAVLLAFPDVWLRFSAVEPELGAHVGHFLHILLFAIGPVLVFRAVYALNTSVSRPKVVMIINLAGLALKIPLNHVLIFGDWGLPALGASGCAIATVIVTSLTCTAGLIVVAVDRFYDRFEIRWSPPRWSRQKEILRLGIPIGLSYTVEITGFTFMTLIAARLGPTPTSAHQIAANLIGTLYAVPFALCVAISTLVGQSLGSGALLEARALIASGARLVFGCAIATAALIALLRTQLLAFYTSDPAVAAIASTLLLMVGLNHVADAAQTLGSFVLRAYKHAIAPTVVYTVSLWGIGLVGGYRLAIHGLPDGHPLGALGLWFAATAGLLVAACALLLYLRRVSRAYLGGAQESPGASP